jgi:hypothetical protein
MWIFLVISVAIFVGSIFGISYWNKRVNKWSIFNYPDDGEYFLCMAIGWGFMMMLTLSVIGIIGSILGLTLGGLTTV